MNLALTAVSDFIQSMVDQVIVSITTNLPIVFAVLGAMMAVGMVYGLLKMYMLDLTDIGINKKDWTSFDR